MAELGIKDITVQLLNMDMVESQREGRIVILYHSIAMIVMAMLVYMITANVPMKRNQIAVINGTVTTGYLTTIIAGPIFAYFGHNWTLHGIYLFGLSLFFLSGALLAIALWPWRKEYYLEAGFLGHGHGHFGFGHAGGLVRFVFWQWLHGISVGRYHSLSKPDHAPKGSYRTFTHYAGSYRHRSYPDIGPMLRLQGLLAQVCHACHDFGHHCIKFRSLVGNGYSVSPYHYICRLFLCHVGRISCQT